MRDQRKNIGKGVIKMGKNQLKKIGIIVIGALSLFSTSLSIVAIVKSSKVHHIPPHFSAHVQEHQDGCVPKDAPGPHDPRNVPESQERKDKPQSSEDVDKSGDEKGHHFHKKGERKQDNKP